MGVIINREQAPVCFETWKKREITNDREPNHCKINLKRYDSFWGDWNATEVTIDTVNEFQNVSIRLCSYVWAHGGHKTCLGDPQFVLEWYVWDKNFRNWYDAKRNCKMIGGKLFYDLDGTE